MSPDGKPSTRQRPQGPAPVSASQAPPQASQASLSLTSLPSEVPPDSAPSTESPASSEPSAVSQSAPLEQISRSASKPPASPPPQIEQQLSTSEVQSARAPTTSPSRPPAIPDAIAIPTVSPPPSTASPSAAPAASNKLKRPSSASSTAVASPSKPPKRQRRSRAKNSDPDAEREGSMGSERPRLTEQEKKNNHIASEQKRRMAIREGFDRLTEIVPGLEGQGRSESVVLKKSVDHMRDVLNERQQLIERIQALGGEIPPELRR